MKIEENFEKIHENLRKLCENLLKLKIKNKIFCNCKPQTNKQTCLKTPAKKQVWFSKVISTADLPDYINLSH